MNTVRSEEDLRGRMAAKRAVARCVTKNFRKKISAKDIAIVSHLGEKPEVRITSTRMNEQQGAHIAQSIDFSITHTRGIAVARAIPKKKGRIGIDMEAVRTFATPTVKAFLTEREYHTLHSLPRHARRHRTTLIWCIKEAYLKAIGTGLRTHPARIEVTGSPLLRSVRLTHDGHKVHAHIGWRHYHKRFILVSVILPPHV